MIHLEEDLFLCNLGTVWTKKDGWFGEHVLLGSAHVSQGILVTDRDVKPLSLDDLHP
jgi:hypothetical protein